jgi:hypothetical protein
MELAKPSDNLAKLVATTQRPLNHRSVMIRISSQSTP